MQKCLFGAMFSSSVKSASLFFLLKIRTDFAGVELDKRTIDCEELASFRQDMEGGAIEKFSPYISFHIIGPLLRDNKR